MIEANEVDCQYGSLKVLQNINLSAKEGELLGVIGPNGSGKSSLIKCMSRILKPKAGTVFVNEKDIFSCKTKAVAREVAVVPQDSNIAFPFTALEAVLMGRTPHLGRFESESAADIEIAKKSMKRTNTLYLADRAVDELSGGERQRVVIARALAQEPRVILLDEPTSNLDINHKIEILDLLKNLCAKEGLIVIVAIHDLNLAAQYCASLAMLDKGRIAHIGRPDEVLTPEHIKKVFSVKVLVKRHPVTGYLDITLLSAELDSANKKDFSVHVICGGGTGGAAINIFFRKGYRVSAGVLNALDSDYEVAQTLGIPMVSEAPFSPITDEAHLANQGMIEKADAVVLTSPPVGKGNIKNIEAARFALAQQKHLFILKETGEAYVDHSGGVEEGAFNDLIDSGAIAVTGQNELLTVIEGLERSGQNS